MEEVITEPYVNIKTDQASMALMSDWMGSPTAEQFKDGKSKILEVIIDRSLSIMVLNYYDMAAYLNLETQVWAINEWFPKIIDENIKQVGIVIPSKVMAQIVVKSIYSGLSEAAEQHGVELSYFDNVTQLQEWINYKVKGRTAGPPPRHSMPESSHRRPTARPAKPASSPKQGGVDLGGSSSPSGPDYSQMDDEIHDDPFA